MKAWPIRTAAMGLAIVALVAGCRDSKDTERYALDGKLVVFNYRVATARFLVNLKHLRTPGEGEVAVASFENPAGGDAIEVREKIWPATDKTTLTTPPLRCIVKDHPYKIAIKIEDSAGQPVQTIDTTVTSSEDQTLLPDKPLVVGPFYTPNPEMKGRSVAEQAAASREDCPNF
ncbi:hypothetical protein [Mesorhizobium denitrificans]|nr:hypothetical protein [Mesorhizobium denitrificans]